MDLEDYHGESGLSAEGQALVLSLASAFASLPSLRRLWMAVHPEEMKGVVEAAVRRAVPHLATLDITRDLDQRVFEREALAIAEG